MEERYKNKLFHYDMRPIGNGKKARQYRGDSKIEIAKICSDMDPALRKGFAETLQISYSTLLHIMNRAEKGGYALHNAVGFTTKHAITKSFDEMKKELRSTPDVQRYLAIQAIEAAGLDASIHINIAR